MNDKAYVSMEQAVCPVCGCTFDTGSILLDRRLKNSMERHTTTHMEMCPEHNKLFNEGYIALIETTSQPGANGLLKQENALRTGQLCHVSRRMWDHVFDVEAPEGGIVFVEPGVIDKLKGMVDEQKSA